MSFPMEPLIECISFIMCQSYAIVKCARTFIHTGNRRKPQRRNEIVYQITLSFHLRNIKPASKKIEMYNNFHRLIITRKRFYFLINNKWKKKKNIIYGKRDSTDRCL